MRKRDLDILASLEKFKVLDSKMIAELHFYNLANPIQTANRVLKRLRTDGYIVANTDNRFSPYLYFLNPSPIKIDSQKLDHYLLIANTFIDMNKYGKVSSFEVERKPEHAQFIPDGFAEWLGKKWFIECQNSLYTANMLYKKIDKYVSFYEQGFLNPFPNVLIIGKQNLQFQSNDYPFKISCVKSIHDLKSSIEKAKQKKSITLKSGTPLRLK